MTWPLPFMFVAEKAESRSAKAYSPIGGLFMWSARRSLAAIMLELVAIERHADAWPCRYENVKVPVDQGFGDDFVSKPDASDALGAVRDTALGCCDRHAGRRDHPAFKARTALARNAP